jgi:cytoskeletal protein CcmA (bactofilin family)
MVFNRKPDPNAAEMVAPATRRADRPAAAARPPMPAGGAVQGAQSVIGNNLSIDGQNITIRCKGSLKIDGTIQADVHSKQLEVGREAMINGSIAADTVSVFGRVNGAILGANVVLHASAQVEGDIHSQFLTVEQGAAFDGRSRRVTDPTEIAPQVERTSPPHLGLPPTASAPHLHS